MRLFSRKKKPTGKGGQDFHVFPATGMRKEVIPRRITLNQQEVQIEV